MLKTKVYLSGVTNLSDARYAAGMGVDYLGFNINPSSTRYVTSEEVKTISDWISGVTVVGELDDRPIDQTEEYRVNTLLTNNPALVSVLDEPILRVEVNNTNVKELSDLLDSKANEVSFFILEILNIDLEDVQQSLIEYCDKYNIYLATNYNVGILSTVLDLIQPMGIVLYGSDEEKPGLSNYDGIADILEQLELD